MSDTDIEFDPSIPVTRLPDGWTVESRYETSVYLKAPEGQPEHVIIQYWAEEGDDPQYLVEPMVESSLSGATAQSDKSRSKVTSDLGAAVDHAISVANDLAQ